MEADTVYTVVNADITWESLNEEYAIMEVESNFGNHVSTAPPLTFGIAVDMSILS